MFTEADIIETLQDAGCDPMEIKQIIACYQKGAKKKTEKLIAECKKNQLDKLHECQQCIDRLDYLSYKIEQSEQKE